MKYNMIKLLINGEQHISSGCEWMASLRFIYIRIYTIMYISV